MGALCAHALVLLLAEWTVLSISGGAETDRNCTGTGVLLNTIADFVRATSEVVGLVANVTLLFSAGSCSIMIGGFTGEGCSVLVIEETALSARLPLFLRFFARFRSEKCNS